MLSYSHYFNSILGIKSVLFTLEILNQGVT